MQLEWHFCIKGRKKGIEVLFCFSNVKTLSTSLLLLLLLVGFGLSLIQINTIINNNKKMQELI